MTAPNSDSTAAAENFFAGAVAAGLRTVVVSPGSRSTPLAIAADRTPGLDVHVHLDERCAAFAALGQAKVLGSPVGLVCTSGTAAANYLPAIAEAAMSNVELVAITADRPPEHQHIGVGQTFDQRGLYGTHVRHELTMPVGGDGGPEFAVRAGWRATVIAAERRGPVHVNWPFRLPLEPAAAPISPPPVPERPSTTPAPPSADDVEALADELDRATAPLIIAGPDRPADHPTSRRCIDAANVLNIPIVADVLSGLRGRANGSRAVLDASSLLFEGPLPEPDLVIRLGNTPTAKSTRLWWESNAARHILVDPLDDWHDPSNRLNRRLVGRTDALLEAVSARVDPVDEGWISSWIDRATAVAAVRAGVLDSWPTVTEAHVARCLEAQLRSDDLLVASSSMPVRDLDTFTSSALDATVVANRGINGIDGVLSTAIGAARARPDARVVALVGDVAALHDVGGLLDAARQGIDLTVVIPNNDGGGIFSFLPARSALPDEQFERYFHTGHGTSFDFLSHHRGIEYHDGSTDLDATLRAATDGRGVNIVEVAVSTTDRLSLHEELLGRLRR